MGFLGTFLNTDEGRKMLDIYEKLKMKDFEVIGNIHDNPELLEV